MKNYASRFLIQAKTSILIPAINLENREAENVNHVARDQFFKVPI